MTIIYILALILIVAISFLVYYSSASKYVKLGVTIAALTMAVATDHYYQQMLGMPISGYPDGEFSIVSYSINNNPTKQLVFWATTAVREKKVNRLYVIPYNREDAKKMEKMVDSKGKIKGKFNTKPNEDGQRRAKGKRLDEIQADPVIFEKNANQ